MADIAELSKYIKSESVEILRSDLHFAEYNPRIIDDLGRKSLKKGIKKFGLLGGIIVNRQTGNTIVSGHQRVSVMDDLNGYPGNDYLIRVDMIDVDLKSEKELNILLNNPNAQGQWDFDKLRELVPDIDYKSAGLTDADLSMIGVDYLLKTEGENDIADELDSISTILSDKRKADKAALQKDAGDYDEDDDESEDDDEDYEPHIPEMTYEDKRQHMKDVKAEVKQKAMENAENLDAYVVLSFDTFKAKAAFCERFGFHIYDKYIKGEVFDDMVERVE